MDDLTSEGLKRIHDADEEKFIIFRASHHSKVPFSWSPRGDTLNASSQGVFCETLHLDVHAAVAVSARAQLFT